MFELIDKVNNSKKKKFFLEKINIYIKLVELISRSLNLKLFRNNYKFNKKTLLRICELNIYKSNVKDNNKLLVQILKKNLYQQFIAAINFNVKYKRKIGNLLDKFDDTKRNIININNNYNIGNITMDKDKKGKNSTTITNSNKKPKLITL
jgi:DNA (cytosine-5)-methyltransferase 1